MNMLLSIAFILTALSIVTERVLALVQHYRTNGQIDSNYPYFIRALVIGFLFSLVLRLDLIWLIRNLYTPELLLGWGRSLTGLDYLSLPIGSFLSACLISWGAQCAKYIILLGRQKATKNSKELHYLPKDLDIARLAIGQNEQALRKNHSNIYKLLPAFFIEEGVKDPCVDICLSDNNKAGLPHYLNFRLPDGRKGSLQTRIIPSFTRVRPHLGMGSQVVNDNTSTYVGTLGCLLSGNQADVVYALTCNHVLTGGTFDSPGTIGDLTAELVSGTPSNIGTWEAGIMNGQADAALIKLSAGQALQSNGLSTTPYTVSDKDCSTCRVTLNGALSGEVSGFIIHIGQPFEIDYTNQSVPMSDLITLSADTNVNNFTTLTQAGDSGSVVYNTATKQIIGIVVGGNDQFTFVIPIQRVFSSFPSYSLSISK